MKKEHEALLLMMSTVVLFFLYLLYPYPRLYDFFSVYSPAVMVIVNGVIRENRMTGHSYAHGNSDVCKKCGKTHRGSMYWLNRRLGKEITDKISKSKKGVKTGPQKQPRTEEHRKKLSLALKGRTFSVEARYHMYLGQTRRVLLHPTAKETGQKISRS